MSQWGLSCCPPTGKTALSKHCTFCTGPSLWASRKLGSRSSLARWLKRKLALLCCLMIRLTPSLLDTLCVNRLSRCPLGDKARLSPALLLGHQQRIGHMCAWNNPNIALCAHKHANVAHILAPTTALWIFHHHSVWGSRLILINDLQNYIPHPQSHNTRPGESMKLFHFHFTQGPSSAGMRRCHRFLNRTCLTTGGSCCEIVPRFLSTPTPDAPLATRILWKLHLWPKLTKQSLLQHRLQSELMHGKLKAYRRGGCSE